MHQHWPPQRQCACAASQTAYARAADVLHLVAAVATSEKSSPGCAGSNVASCRGLPKVCMICASAQCIVTAVRCHAESLRQESGPLH